MPVEEPQFEASEQEKQHGEIPVIPLVTSGGVEAVRRWLSPLFLSGILVAPLGMSSSVEGQEKEKSSVVKDDLKVSRIPELLRALHREKDEGKRILSQKELMAMGSAAIAPLVAVHRDPKTSEEFRRMVDAFLYDMSGKLIGDIRDAWPKLKLDEQTREILDQPETDVFEAHCKTIGAPAFRRLIDEPIEPQEYVGMYDFWHKVTKKMVAADASLDQVLIGLLGRPLREERDPAPYRIREALRSAGPRVIPALTKVVEGTYWAEKEWKLSPALEVSFKSYVAQFPVDQQEAKGREMRGKLNEVPWAMSLPSRKDSNSIAIESTKIARKARKVGSPQGGTAAEVAEFLLEQPTVLQTDEAVEIFLRSLTHEWKSRERFQALFGIERIGSDAAVDTLRTLALRKDLPFTVRLSSAEALVRVDTRGKTQGDIGKLLTSTDMWERRVAVGAFLLQAQRIYTLFEDAAFRDATAQQDATSFYKILLPKLLTVLMKAKGDADPALRGEAARALGILLSVERTQWGNTNGAFIRHPAILTAINTLLRDDPALAVRRMAVDALVLHPFSDPLTIDPLLSRAIDAKEDPGIRATALNGLARRNSLFLLTKAEKLDTLRSTCTAILSGQKGKRASYLEQSAAVGMGSILQFSYDPVSGSDIHGKLSIDQKKALQGKREEILRTCLAFYRDPFREYIVQDLQLDSAVTVEFLRSCPEREEEQAERLMWMLRRVWEEDLRIFDQREIRMALAGLLAEEGKEQNGIPREARAIVREAATAFVVSISEDILQTLQIGIKFEYFLDDRRQALSVHLQALPLPVRREVIRELGLDIGLESESEDGMRRWRILAMEDGTVRVEERKE